MKPSRAAAVMRQLLETRWSVFLWGPPGSGKSSVVRQVGQDTGLAIIDVRASMLDPTDIRGIPTLVDGRTVWWPPGFLPTEATDGGILFLDELNSAPPLVQASLYQLVLDGRVGEYVLPTGWHVVAAGNRAQDRSVVFRMPAALANRFVHLDFEVDYEDWRAWAVGHDIHPLVIGFLGLRRELLSQPPANDHAFATPRSWEMASDVVKGLGSGDDAGDVLVGVVGEGAAIEFLAYAESAMREADVERIIGNPARARLPEDLAGLYALVSYVASRGDETSVRSAAGVLLSRLTPELAVLLCRDLIGRHPGFLTDPGYLAFIERHRELFR